MNTLFHDLKHQFEDGILSKADFISQMHERLHSILFSYAKELINTDICAVEISDEKVIMISRSDGLRIAVDSEDQRIAPIETLNFGSYEPDETIVIRRIAAKMDVMLDIGANIGWYSLLAAKINPEATIHAFEPIPTTFGRLIENCSLNICKKLKCHNYGFSAVSGSFPFYFYPEGGVNASMKNLSNRANVVTVDCELRTLDSFLSHIPSDKKVDFLKCDVEGNELFVLDGGLDLLRQHKPVLLLELLRKWSAKFGYHPNQAITLLENLGYQPYTATPDGFLAKFSKITDDTNETNFFFVHPESRLRDAILYI